MQNQQLTPSQWINQCAQQLHERWKSVGPEQLEEVAMDIYFNDELRTLPPADAAIAWLSPITSAPRN